MLKIETLKKVTCNTLEELENYIKLSNIMPDIAVIGEAEFTRNETYKNTCNEFYEHWEINNQEPCKLKYEFRVINGSHYLDGEYKVNSYNFDKCSMIK